LKDEGEKSKGGSSLEKEGTQRRGGTRALGGKGYSWKVLRESILFLLKGKTKAREKSSVGLRTWRD